ncbi:MAG TPA: GNAT family N-acetyltransferase [Saprospiraceae bacterium]|nr:GNAT family N-acetyltransferase [Saprospiraceae bacterium]
MTNDPSLQIRLATIEDEDFIVSLIPRLTEFGPPPWRYVPDMTEYDILIILKSLHEQPEGTVIFIAEDENQAPLGFIHLFLGSDYYYKEKHANISDLIIAKDAEGRGAGQKLLQKGEEWARSHGFHWITLSVFAQNQRARDLYQRMGYGEDIMKYVKEL